MTASIIFSSVITATTSKVGHTVYVLESPVQAAHASAVSSPESIDVEKLADAIYLAEGGSKTRFPYGILKKYKHTSPRQACINTIRHKHADWVKGGRKGDFLSYLASKYAPIGASNDPTGLNRNWKANVEYFLERSLEVQA